MPVVIAKYFAESSLQNCLLKFQYTLDWLGYILFEKSDTTSDEVWWQVNLLLPIARIFFTKGRLIPALGELCYSLPLMIVTAEVLASAAETPFSIRVPK